MAKGPTKTALAEEYISAPTKYVAFQATPIRGEATDIEIKTDHFLFSTRALLYLKNKLSLGALEMNIQKIIISWCPLIEPGALSSIKISVSYSMASEIQEQRDNTTIVQLTGKISEHHKVEVYPTHPLLYPKGGRLSIPWKCHVEVDGIMDDGTSRILGLVKIWCPVRTQPFLSSNKFPIKAFKAPCVEWSNLHYPYYIPYFLTKRVRGLSAVDWTKTEQYTRFSKEVLVHVGAEVLPAEKYLSVMQTMSLQDSIDIINMTSGCSLNKGVSYCSCKHAVSDFIVTCLANKTDGYDDHQVIYNNLVTGLNTGRIKSALAVTEPTF
nr:putative cell-to-cell movement protein [Cnidium virus 1]